MKPPEIAPAVPRRGNRLTRWMGRVILWLMRWQVRGALPNLSRFVIIAAPHTSNWDFVIGLAVRLALDLDAHWLGKHTLFRGPFAPFLHWLRGIPVNRSSPQGLIGKLSACYREDRPFVLALAPEGTRSRVKRWKSGFYFVALQAGVPVVPVTFDYKLRTVGILAPFSPTGHLGEDLLELQRLYTQVTPRHPERF
jgi:1-acyl-sn-glycerol-3-phosphate acyltransferase